MIAGIGGASLGTEIFKCLALADHYSIFGCDISSLAYGHYQCGFERTFVVNHENYVESVLEVCRKEAIDVVIPGGEEPLALLNAASDRLLQKGICLAANSPPIIKDFSDKLSGFRKLAELGFRVPQTVMADGTANLQEMSYPCVVKPATGSGGSSFVFLAADRDEAMLYVNYLTRNNKTALVQEYVSAEEGEVTIGVLSLPNCEIVGSIALKRVFNSKLSVLMRSETGMISTGYSQGLIDDFRDVRKTAENIAVSIGSTGPINVQGRLRNGELIPFEINPRFSASTYLRALAGFNEVDIYLQYLVNGSFVKPDTLRPGYYLRSLDEVFIAKDALIL